MAIDDFFSLCCKLMLWSVRIMHMGRQQVASERQQDAHDVSFTIMLSLMSCSIRGVSCLPGARPGGCATLECEGSIDRYEKWNPNQVVIMRTP
jgi:hypothetical protein